MIVNKTLVVMGIGFALAMGAADVRAKEPQYVGAKKCKTCHKKELIGNQYGKWEEMKHAKAYDTLKGEDALKIAKEKGLSVPPSEAKECLECHATAYGEDAAKFAQKPLAVQDGVQCEACHGPGSLYKKKKTMADREKSLAAGMWDPGKDEKICTGCHNDRSPTFESFDFEKRKEEIAHPIPEDVKGKYLEVEKKLKAEKRARGEAVDEEEEEE